MQPEGLREGSRRSPGVLGAGDLRVTTGYHLPTLRVGLHPSLPKPAILHPILHCAESPGNPRRHWES